MSKSSIETTKRKKQAFLDSYPNFLRATKTALAIGIDESCHYRWLGVDEVYKEAFQAVKKKVDRDRLEENEAEIHRRGLEKSDLLLMFETKKLDPDYREKVAGALITGDITIKLAIPDYDVPRLKEADVIEGKAREVTNAIEQGKE